MKKIELIWLVVGAYGVWFAVLSGLEEITNGKYWKVIVSSILGVIAFYLYSQKKR